MNYHVCLVYTFKFLLKINLKKCAHFNLKITSFHLKKYFVYVCMYTCVAVWSTTTFGDSCHLVFEVRAILFLPLYIQASSQFSYLASHLAIQVLELQTGAFLDMDSGLKFI